MARILIGGAGGAPSNNVIMSLRSAGGDYLIGMCSSPVDLFLADVDERYVVPMAVSSDYPARLLSLIDRTRPDLLHVQHDFEVRSVSRLRERVLERRVKLLLPAPRTVEDCVDKARTYSIWRAAGLPVPATFLITDEISLREAFGACGGRVWLRAIEGGGGAGALPTDNYEFARLWITQHDGWGRFTAAEQLSPQSVTWSSIWYRGELAVAQTRRRHGWLFAGRTLSGVTGITAVGETCSEPKATEVALAAIRAIDREPNGIFSVDMTYDAKGEPNPTEINIGRFFTTIHFFTAAGVNFPRIYRDLALTGKLPELPRRINPLPDGLVWLRGMDVPPVLKTSSELADAPHAWSA